MVSTPLRAGESLQDWIHRYGEKLAAVERIFTYSNSAYYLTPAHNAWTPFPLGEVIDQIMEQMPKDQVGSPQARLRVFHDVAQGQVQINGEPLTIPATLQRQAQYFEMILNQNHNGDYLSADPQAVRQTMARWGGTREFKDVFTRLMQLKPPYRVDASSDLSSYIEPKLRPYIASYLREQGSHELSTEQWLDLLIKINAIIDPLARPVDVLRGLILNEYQSTSLINHKLPAPLRQAALERLQALLSRHPNLIRRGETWPKSTILGDTAIPVSEWIGVQKRAIHQQKRDEWATADAKRLLRSFGPTFSERNQSYLEHITEGRIIGGLKRILELESRSTSLPADTRSDYQTLLTQLEVLDAYANPASGTPPLTPGELDRTVREFILNYQVLTYVSPESVATCMITSLRDVRTEKRIESAERTTRLAEAARRVTEAHRERERAKERK